MISVHEALDAVLLACHPMGLERVPLLEAAGRVIGENVTAPRDIPSAANSAMDGYAVRAEDIQKASATSPVTLRVIETIAAGSLPQKTVTRGQAARIMTGALIPKGANAVIRREDTEEQGQHVQIQVSAPVGMDIRLPGEDVRMGAEVIAAGDVLSPGHIGMLAALGRSFVSVYQKPRVTILSTGDELVDIESQPAPGKIVNSNSFALAAQISACGGIPVMMGIVPDNKEEMARAFDAAASADVIISSGGVSMGDYDFVKDVMGDAGNAMQFWQVAMRPGKPLAFGNIRGVPLFGLPGNPVSVMVSFEQFVRPFLLKMQGHTRLSRPVAQARNVQEIQKKSGLRYFLRAVVTPDERGALMARLTGDQGSGILTSMLEANALIVLPEKTTRVKIGETVTIQWL